MSETEHTDQAAAPSSEPITNHPAPPLSHPDPRQLLYQVREIFHDQLYLRHGIRVGTGDVVIDAGANVGVAAVFFAVVCGATVHSFEPVAPIYEVLLANTGPIEACTAHSYGLAAKAGNAAITYYPNADAMSGLYADRARDLSFARTVHRNMGGVENSERLEDRYAAVPLTCELRTLSAVVNEHSIDRVDLLKIDVERAELDVLKGIDGQDWPRIKQVVAEVHDDAGGLSQFTDVLESKGFRVTVDQDKMMESTDVYMAYCCRV